MTLTKQFFNPILAVLLLVSIAVTGCGPRETDKKDDQAKKEFHVHGPHAGGECFRFDGNTDFAVEVVSPEENDVVRLLFTDYDGKEKIEVASESLTLKRKKEDEEAFELTEIAGEEEGMLKGFELNDEDLKSAIKIPMIATITIEEEELTGKTKAGH